MFDCLTYCLYVSLCTGEYRDVDVTRGCLYLPSD